MRSTCNSNWYARNPAGLRRARYVHRRGHRLIPLEGGCAARLGPRPAVETIVSVSARCWPSARAACCRCSRASPRAWERAGTVAFLWAGNQRHIVLLPHRALVGTTWASW